MNTKERVAVGEFAALFERRLAFEASRYCRGGEEYHDPDARSIRAAIGAVAVAVKAACRDLMEMDIEPSQGS